MLDLQHWQFWVVDAETVRQRAGKTVGIVGYGQHAVGTVVYDDLAVTTKPAVASA